MSQGVHYARMTELSQKPVYFNVMLAGEAGTGKSKFLEYFLGSAFGKQGVVEHEKLQITEYSCEKVEQNVRFCLNMIDCPGYHAQKPVKEWYQEIKSYLKLKQQHYEELKKLALKEKSLSLSSVVDRRVHACLYFFTGPRLKANDAIYMKKLSKLVNLIPVFSCEQDLELEEVEVLKAQILDEAHKYRIDWFQIDQAVGGLERVSEQIHQQQDPSEKLLRGIWPYPPFYFYSGTAPHEDDVGEVDTRLLTALLLGYLSVPMGHATEVIWALREEKERKKSRKQEKQLTENKMNLGMGVAIGMGVLGALIIAKKVLN